MKSVDMRISKDWNAVLRAASQAHPEERWMEHRWGWRRPCRARVCVSTGGGVTGGGGLRDVSMSGAFLETSLPLPLFAQIAIAVVRRDGSHAGEFTATVVRRAADGVGIEWSEPVSGSVCEVLECRGKCEFNGSRP